MTNCDKKNPADSVHARGASQTGCRKHWARGGEGQRLRLRCAPQQGSRGRPAIRGGEMSETKSPHSGLTRRNFLKATAAVTGMSVLAGSAATLAGCSTATEGHSLSSTGEEQIFSTICRSNCFQACLLNAHVRDGKVVKMSRGDYPEEIYSGCCLRGLSIPERTYSDNRIKYPLKRAEGTTPRGRANGSVSRGIKRSRRLPRRSRAFRRNTVRTRCPLGRHRATTAEFKAVPLPGSST